MVCGLALQKLKLHTLNRLSLDCHMTTVSCDTVPECTWIKRRLPDTSLS